MVRVVARAISNRATGAMVFTGPEGARRIVFRDGDSIAATSTAPEDSLVAFLGIRGDLPRETLRGLGNPFPSSGRHAGAALVARGYLRQDQCGRRFEPTRSGCSGVSSKCRARDCPSSPNWVGGPPENRAFSADRRGPRSSSMSPAESSRPQTLSRASAVRTHG